MSRQVVLAVDVEPDSRIASKSDSWIGTAQTIDALSSLRRELAARCEAPACFNWFLRLDPQIAGIFGTPHLICRQYPDLLPRIERENDLCGIHVHFAKWDERSNSWYSDFADSQWSAECLGFSIEAYRSEVGRLPLASRCGDRWVGNREIQFLRNNGVRYDLTVEPGARSVPVHDDPKATAYLPDFRGAPCEPYQPRWDDFLTPVDSDAEDGFWEIPVGMTESRKWHRTGNWPFWVRTRVALNLVLRPEKTWRQIDKELWRDTDVPLVLVMRSGDLSRPDYFASFEFIVQGILSHPRIHTCRFVTADRAVASFVASATRPSKP